MCPQLGREFTKHRGIAVGFEKIFLFLQGYTILR